jgi:hypothetical protein
MKFNSAELEQLRVNVNGMDQYKFSLLEYRIICGSRLLCQPLLCALQCANGQNNIYGSAFMFIRFYFNSIPCLKEGDKIVKKRINDTYS